MTKEEQIAEAAYLHRRGYSIRNISIATGLSKHYVNKFIRPEAYASRREKSLAYNREYRIKHFTGQRRTNEPNLCERVMVPQEVLAERERALSAEVPFSVAFFGDPLPGRSALDKRNANMGSG